MLAVIGTFRLPPENVAEARPLMLQVTAETLREDGCLAYSYAQDIADPGLFHVHELWRDKPSLDAHFATPHMREWSAQRTALGFHDRCIFVHAIEAGRAI